MNCADAEILICDDLDGALSPVQKLELERHLAGCEACADMAADVRSAVAFMDRAAEVEPPPQLVTRILFDAPWRQVRPSAASGIRGWFERLLDPVLQPRLAMGMAMTILSVAMLAKFVAPVRQLQPSDLDPVKIWAELEDRAYRAWERSVKFYDNLRFVYQVQTTLREWEQQQDEQKTIAPEADERRLPAKKAPETGNRTP
jgi:hypothetical protein